MISGSREVEAKFVVQDPSVFGSIARLKSIGPFRLVRKGRERQQNVYLDTPDLRLRRARVALRLRTIGRRVALSFKQERRYSRGISDRVEISRILDRRALDRLRTGALDTEPVRRAKAIVGERPLRPVLTLKTDRQMLLFSAGREQMELDLDRVKVKRGNRTMAAHFEVELENRSASRKAFSQALRMLRGRWGKDLRLSRIPKYETGLRLLKAVEQKRGGGV